MLALQALRSEEGALLEAVAARRRELAELAAAVQVRMGGGGVVREVVGVGVGRDKRKGGRWLAAGHLGTGAGGCGGSWRSWQQRCRWVVSMEDGRGGDEVT